MATEKRQEVPLYVDLDGTLVFTDCLHESFMRLLHDRLLSIFLVILWLLRGGRSYMKAQIAVRADIDVTTLPYNQLLINWLREEKERGREIILATAADQKYARQIADHLRLFDRVIASDGSNNLKGARKAARLVEESGEGGFDYAGDSRADLKVWKHARGAVVVSNRQAFLEQIREQTPVVGHFPDWQHFLSFRALRPHQWLKNVLLFVPLLTSHRFYDIEVLFSALIAFIAFSLCASSVYILNDLLDIEADRSHLRKQKRPFASGRASIAGGILMAVILLISAFSIATLVSDYFVEWLGIYYLLTVAYSLYLKKVVVVDILVLASLYTIRIIAGAIDIEVPLSHWLLAFSMFFFFSLSLVKRYAELESVREQGEEARIPGRKYCVKHAPLILWPGLLCGYMAVAVLSRYIVSPDVLPLYSHATLLWLTVPLMFTWVSWIWWSAHKGTIHSDPVIFVLEDRVGQGILALLILVVLLAV